MENQKLLPIGDLFKKSFQFYKSKLYVIMVLGLIPFAGFVVVSLFTEGLDPKRSDVFNLSLFLGALLISLAGGLVTMWVQIAFYYLIKNKDVAPNAKGLLTIAWNKIISYAWVYFLTGIIVLGGFLLLIVPGIIFSVWFSLSSYFFVFEDARGMQALYKSKALVKGYWWPVFGRLFVVGFLSGLIGALPVIGPIVNIFFVMPFWVIYGYFIYENLKGIKAQS